MPENKFEFKVKPYEHQLEVFNRFKDFEYFALFADMGTGKTKIAIDIATHKFLNNQIDAVMVIAPNGVHAQWVDEQLVEHSAIPYSSFMWNSKKTKGKKYISELEYFLSVKDKRRLRYFAVNVEAFQYRSVLKYVRLFVTNNRCFTIEDEASKIKNPSTTRSKMIHLLNKYGHRAILTGTPTPKSPFNLWSQFEFLKKDFFHTNYFIFQHRYGVMAKGYNQRAGKNFNSILDKKTFGIVKYAIKKFLSTKDEGYVMSDQDFDELASSLPVSARNVAFIHKTPVFTKFKDLDKLRKIIAPFTYSVKKEDCLDLPPKIYEPLYLEMSKEQSKVYNDLKKKLYAMYEGKELSVQNKLTLSTRLLQICGGFFPYMEDDNEEKKNFKVEVIDASHNVKLQRLIEVLEEVGDHTKVIVWAVYQAELEMLYKELSKDYTVALYYGKTTIEKRAQIKLDFKAGMYDIFLANTATGGMGLNLQNATVQLYYSNDFKTENRLQAEDRSHRSGVKDTCVYTDFLYKGTMDEVCYNSIREGRDLNNYFKEVSLKELLNI